MPVLTTERGDTLQYTYPIPDSVYKHDEIIIKIRPSALNMNNLCYTIPSQYDPTLKFYGTYNNTNIDDIPDYFKSQLMSHKFTINELINNSNLAVAMNLIGVDSIRRMTSANPCEDTISISRLGDTLKCDDFLWFVLELNNDTNVVAGCLYLTITQQNSIYFAEPNYKIELTATPINDSYFGTEQISLSQNYGIGIERAWDFETGNYNIKIGVVDDGINWEHCEFGLDMGENLKISSGWNYWNPVPYDPKDPDKYKKSLLSIEGHGTQVAGIIGALTNRGSCGTNNNSVAGIAGGWYDPQHEIANLGCNLIALKVHSGEGYDNYLDQLVSAVREASTNSIKYGGKVDILNFSVRLFDGLNLDIFSETFRSAIIYAFENNVSIVASRGNEGVENKNYPSCFSSSLITSVGGANGEIEFGEKCRFISSSYGEKMDLLAPWGSHSHVPPFIEPLYINVFTPFKTGTELFANFWGTSASAPHVSGVIGLLRSYALKQNQYNLYSDLEPEDYEGMLKASAYDIDGTYNNVVYNEGYDINSGWGYLKADRLFDMLADGYRVDHYSSTGNVVFGEWSQPSEEFIHFENSGLNSKPIPSGNYKAQIRTCTTSLTIPNIYVVDEANNINRYVWARSNRDGVGGFSLEKPNYQLKYTQITSGERGIDGTEGVDGIFHNNNLTVTGITYQYKVTINGIEIDYPSDSEIAINFSVFGKPIPVSIKEQSEPEIVTLSPNPFSNEISLISNNNPLISNFNLEIYNLLGSLVYSNKSTGYYGKNNITINTERFHKGVYLLRISINNSTINKIMVKL